MVRARRLPASELMIKRPLISSDLPSGIAFQLFSKSLSAFVVMAVSLTGVAGWASDPIWPALFRLRNLPPRLVANGNWRIEVHPLDFHAAKLRAIEVERRPAGMATLQI